MVSQDYKGQTYLSLHHDIHPQIKIENKSGIKLFFAQYSNNENKIINDCVHFKWIGCVNEDDSTYYTMSVFSEKFPELPSANQIEKESLALASDPEGQQLYNILALCFLLNDRIYYFR